MPKHGIVVNYFYLRLTLWNPRPIPVFHRGLASLFLEECAKLRGIVETQLNGYPFHFFTGTPQQ